MPIELNFENPDSSKQASERLLEKLFLVRWPVTLALSGGVLLLLGSFFLGNPLEETKVEVLNQDKVMGVSSEGAKMVVEIAGEVQNPGVFELELASRVEDLLAKSGGLSASADRTWVEKNINRAQKLVDGQKVYIPKQGEYGDSYSSSAARSSQALLSNNNIQSKININSASLKELDKLSGIGTTRAQAIIDNRPFGTIDELVSRKVIPKSIFEKIKEQIVAQ